MRAVKRIPPHSLEAERAVLGGLLIDNSVIDHAAAVLRAEDFYRERHRLIYEAICDLWHRHEAADVLTVQEALSRRGKLEAAGGLPYLGQLFDLVPSTANFGHYARIVADKAVVRRAIHLAHTVADEGFDNPEDVAAFVQGLERRAFALGSGRRGRKATTSLSDVLGDVFTDMDRVRERGSAQTGVPTGFVDLDKKFDGLQPGSLVVVAARPSMGKTSFALNVVQNAAMGGVPAVFFSLEMSNEDLGRRILSTEAGISSWRIRHAKLTNEQWPALTMAANRLAKAPIFLDDTAGLTPTDIRSRARRLKAEHGIGLVVVDYLQLMTSPRRPESREREISEFSRSLKGLARELDVPVIALSQLNRDVEKREDKRPRMGDLRESGAIEQDADVIFFIYRDVVYHPSSDQPRLAELIIAKHRSGPIGTVRLCFDADTTRFDNFTDADPFTSP